MQVEIRVQGQIEEHRSTWFDDMKIINPNPNETILIGHVRDQAALYGLIAKVRDLGLLIRFLKCINQIAEDDLDR